MVHPLFLYIKMTSVNTAVGPDKESVYYQGSLAQMQARQFTSINRDNITFMDIIKDEPKKQSYTDTKEFDARISKFTFLSNKFIYKKVIDDARVIPNDIVIKNRMDEYFSPRFYKNIQRLYQNSPLYFDYLFSSDGIAEQRHKQYSVYIYTLCLIEYIMKHYDSNDFKLIKDYQLYYEWALPKYSEQVSYIIKGPLSKSSSIKIDFKKHYATIMNPSNTEGDMTQFLQLASLQNLDAKLTQFFLMMSKMNNAYDKLKDEARTYNLVIRARNTKCYNDPLLNNTFVIDLRGSDFGETDYAMASTASLDTTVGTSSFDMSSRLSLHKLQELFTKYTRFRIVSLNVNRELYNIKLDTLDSVNVVINGIALSSRTVNVINSNSSIDSSLDSFNVPGVFSLTTNNIVSFKPFIDVTTYAPGKVRVNDARLYLINNGIPLSAKLFSVNAGKDTLYNVIYQGNAYNNLTEQLTFIKPMIYTRFQTIIPDTLTYVYGINNNGYISFNPIISKQIESAYNGGSPILIEPNKFTYTFTVDNSNIVNTVMSNDFPSNAEDLYSILGIDIGTKLSSLNIQTGDTVGITLTNNIEHNLSSAYGYNSTIMSLLRNAYTIDSYDIMSPATNIENTDLIGLGYGYYTVYHYNQNGDLLEICTITPNNMVINANNLDKLTVKLICGTLVSNTALYADYTYTNMEDSEGNPMTLTYDSLPLTNVNISAGDSLCVYYYNPLTSIGNAYRLSVIPNAENPAAYTLKWYNGSMIFRDITDIMRIAGEYNPEIPMAISLQTNPITRLYSITGYIPSLRSKRITTNGAILINEIERLGYGNETLRIRNENTLLYSSIPFVSWERLTILPSMYMKTLPMNKELEISLENMDDIFNIQIEFS